ncbi:MAG: flavin reductase family protein [Bacteroidetes bacterium]|nr:flavin reductase family protein [Bacteroidota bacterium]
MLSLRPTDTGQRQFHSYMLGAIAPRPIAFVSTIDQSGNPNVSPFSFFNAMGTNPPILVFSPSRSGRTGKTKNTYDNILEVPEAVVNVVTVSMVHQASLASGEYPKGVNEFEKAGFTQLPSELVRPFRVKESPVQMECKIRDTVETGKGGGAGIIVIAEILLIHLEETILGTDGLIDPDKIQLAGRMGSDFYCNASGTSLFRIPQPGPVLGIGIDALPDQIRTSSYLTGKHLAQLASVNSLPEYFDNASIKKNIAPLGYIKKGKIPVNREKQFYRKIIRLLDEGNTTGAWKFILKTLPDEN